MSEEQMDIEEEIIDISDPGDDERVDMDAEYLDEMVIRLLVEPQVYEGDVQMEEETE